MLISSSVCLSFLFQSAPRFVSLSLSLYLSLFLFTVNSTEICVLLSKYIQSNLITAITFLLGWLTVLPAPLNAAALLLYIPKLLIHPQLSCTFTGALAHPSISLFFSCFPPLLSGYFFFVASLVYSPRQIAHSHFFWLARLISSSLILFLPFSCCPFFHPLCFFSPLSYSLAHSPRQMGYLASFLACFQLFVTTFFFRT